MYFSQFPNARAFGKGKRVKTPKTHKLWNKILLAYHKISNGISMPYMKTMWAIFNTIYHSLNSKGNIKYEYS